MTKVLLWTGRIMAILAALLAVLLALGGSWADALYALFLAAVIWIWTDYSVARWGQWRQKKEAGQSRGGTPDR